MNKGIQAFNEFTVFALQKAGWAPLSVFVVHLVLTKGFNAYDLYPSLDIPMHFLGGIVICYFYEAATRAPHAEFFLGRHSSFSKFILLLALTGLTTVLWEFAEWVVDNYFGERAQVSITDTMLDMLLGLLGGSVVGLWACLSQKT